jgi:hypothetical protein
MRKETGRKQDRVIDSSSLSQIHIIHFSKQIECTTLSELKDISWVWGDNVDPCNLSLTTNANVLLCWGMLMRGREGEGSEI